MILPKVRFPVVTDEMHEWLLNNRPNSDYAKCDWCAHDWHACSCSVGPSCRCGTAQDRRDDTWRPILSYHLHADQARRICHETGVDGWAAMACVGVTPVVQGRPGPVRLKDLLYGKVAG